MAHTICIHSFSQGAGQTTIAVNVAAVLARRGHRVCLILTTSADTTLIHLLGDLGAGQRITLRDAVAGTQVQSAVRDLTELINHPRGKFHLTSLGEGAPLSVNQISELIGKLEDAYRPDVIVIDDPSGIEPSALAFVAFADILGIVMLLDNEHYQGAAVLIELAQRIGVPDLHLIVNKVPQEYSQSEVRAQIEQTFEQSVAVVIPAVQDMDQKMGLLGLQTGHVLAAACEIIAAALVG